MQRAMQRALHHASRIGAIYMRGSKQASISGGAVGAAVGADTGLRATRNGHGVHPREFHTVLTMSVYAAGGACIGSCLPFVLLVLLPCRWVFH
jgi:hypothetical protein